MDVNQGGGGNIYIYIYIYIYNCRQYCFGLLGLISAVLMSGMEVKLIKPPQMSHTCGTSKPCQSAQTITYEDFLRQMDYNGTSNVSPVRASSVTDKLFYKTEYKTSKEQWSFIRFIKPASVWSGHVQYNHS